MSEEQTLSRDLQDEAAQESGDMSVDEQNMLKQMLSSDDNADEEEEMFAAAEELRFEYAAKLRDEIKDLRRELVAAAAQAPA